MPRLSHTDRSVLSCAGAAACDVAAALGLSLDAVAAARRRFGRNQTDGLPGQALLPTRPAGESIDYATLARENQGVL